MTTIESIIDQLKTLPQDYEVNNSKWNIFLLDIAFRNSRSEPEGRLSDVSINERNSGTVFEEKRVKIVLDIDSIEKEIFKLKELKIYEDVLKRYRIIANLIKNTRDNIDNLKYSVDSYRLNEIERLLVANFIKEQSLLLEKCEERFTKVKESQFD